MSTRSPSHRAGIDDIEADIARTREELVGTIDELAARLDIKSRARDRLRDVNGAGVAAVLTAVVAVSATLVIWRRRR